MNRLVSVRVGGKIEAAAIVAVAMGLVVAAAPRIGWAQTPPPAPAGTPSVPPEKGAPETKTPEQSAPGSGAPAAQPGQPGQGATGGGGGAQPSGSQIDIWTEARAVLDKELETVKGLSSVRGVATSEWEHAIEGQSPLQQELELRYALAKPNKLHLASKGMEVFADGVTLTVYAKSIRQYVQGPMPDLRDLRETIERISGGEFRNIPGEVMLRPGMTLEQTLRGVVSVERARNGEIMGRAGTWVTGTANDDRQPRSIPYTFERWYADEDNLVRCVKTDMTKMYQDMVDRTALEETLTTGTPTKAVRYIHVGMTTNYARELNPALGAEEFAFKPGPGDHKVESFVWLTMPGVREQIAMLGKPAPALAGQDFGSVSEKGEVSAPNAIDVASLKGKVVVLDFWATWCGPCCASLPAMQMITQKYADKPFQMIGMNREHGGDEGKVLPFLVHRRLNIQQFNDISGTAAKAFHTETTIPCVVLIDQAGNVADIETGYLPGKEIELMAKIDKLLAGQPVHTPEEIRALNELAAGWKSN